MPLAVLTNSFKFESFQGFGVPKENCQLAYKPGFVLAGFPPPWMTIHLEHLLPNASRNQPGQHKPDTALELPPRCPYSVLLRVGFTWPSLVAEAAVRFYRTFSPLPLNGGLFLWHCP